jgi:site-specific recombinase XerD
MITRLGHGYTHTHSDSFAIQLVRSGVDLRRLQLLFGHSSLNMMQIYLQFKDDDIRDVYQKISFQSSANFYKSES